jgi:hypothetical protein
LPVDAASCIEEERVSPVLRLICNCGRVIRRRPLAVAAAMMGRVAGRVVAVWPDPERPLVAVDLRVPGPAAWVERTFFAAKGDGFRARPLGWLRRAIGEATWSALRARALLVGPPADAIVEVAERALARPLRDPHFALYSTSSFAAKASVFVFEGRAREPSLLVLGASSPSQAAKVRAELGVVEEFRARLRSEPEIVAALPASPLLIGEAPGECLAALPVDWIATWTGHEDRQAALAWLERFQRATSGPSQVLGEAGAERVIVEEAWRTLRPGSLAPVLRRLDERFRSLNESPFESCAVHGDFWRGNIAHRNGEIRVYDWEWARRKGPPMFDLWTYELGELRAVADAGSTGLASGFDAAVRRVERGLRRRGIDVRLAVAALGPVLGDLAIRFRRANGQQGPAEPAYVKLMEVAEARPLL